MFESLISPNDLCDLPKILPIKGVAEGRVIEIRGKVHANADKFAFNIQSDHRLEGKSDIAFHFAPRFSEGQVVRNSFEDGEWKKEERQGGFPFRKDQKFQISILFEWDKYRVLVNGSHFTDFVYRIPKEAAGMLKFEGDICVDSVYFSTDEEALAPPSHSPSLPVMKSIGRMYPGRMIVVKGRPNPECDRFNINLMAGSRDDADVAFHFDVRLDYEGASKALVRNHRKAGSWGKEERSTDEFPFAKNKDFVVIIYYDPVSFKVVVGRKQILEFNHRINPEFIDTLRIDGNVYISDITLSS